MGASPVTGAVQQLGVAAGSVRLIGRLGRPAVFLRKCDHVEVYSAAQLVDHRHDLSAAYHLMTSASTRGWTLILKCAARAGD